MMWCCNPFIGVYIMAQEQLQALEIRLTPVDLLFIAEMQLIQEVSANHHRENLLTTSKVAAIIPDISPAWYKRTF
jgi:hypothetical protein